MKTQTPRPGVPAARRDGLQRRSPWRHLAFGTAVLLAIVAAMPMTLVFTMNECQLSATQPLANACFDRSDVQGKAYLATLAVMTALALALWVAASRWAWLGVVMIPIAPVLIIVALSVAN